MEQNITGVNNFNATATGVKNNIEDFSITNRVSIKNEGIIEGLEIIATSPISPNVILKKGIVAIECDNSEFLIFRLKEDVELIVPNTGSIKKYNLVFHVSLENTVSNPTAQFEIIEGTASNDPQLLEGGANRDFYVVIGQINADANSDISNEEINQDGISFTNPPTGSPEIIARFAGHSGWTQTTDIAEYLSSNSITVLGNKSYQYKTGIKVRFQNNGTTKYKQVASNSAYNGGTGKTEVVFVIDADPIINAPIADIAYSTAQNPFGMADIPGGPETNYIILSASSITPSITNGCALPQQVEFSTNKINSYFADFDPTTDKYGEWSLILPDNWDQGALNAVFYWTTSSGTIGDGVIWGIQAVGMSDDQLIDSAYGTPVEITDTFLGANKMHKSIITADFTASGATKGNPVFFRVYRNADIAGDTLVSVARLFAIKINYKIIE